MAFDFDAEVKKLYNKTVTTTSLKAAYNNVKSQTANTGAGICLILQEQNKENW